MNICALNIIGIWTLLIPTAYLSCARTCSKFVTFGNSYGKHSYPMKKALLNSYYELCKLKTVVWIKVAVWPNFGIYIKGRAPRILWPISRGFLERRFKYNTKNFNLNNWKNAAAINYRMWKITGGSG